jgi:hypothetical protein
MRGDPRNLEELQEWPEDYAIWAGKKLPHNIPGRWLILAALLGCGVLIFANVGFFFVAVFLVSLVSLVFVLLDRRGSCANYIIFLGTVCWFSLAILAVLWAAPALFHALAGPKTLHLLSLALGFRPSRGLSFSHQGASVFVSDGVD